MDRLLNIRDEDIQEKIHRVPEEFASPLVKKFSLRLLQENRRRIEALRKEYDHE